MPTFEVFFLYLEPDQNEFLVKLFFLIGIHSMQGEQSLQGMELQEKEP